MSGFYAFSFDGSNTCGLSYPTPLQWTGNTSFTVSFWLRAKPKEKANNWILDLGNRGNYEGVHWALGPDAKQQMQAMFGFWGDAGYQNRFPFAPYVGKWVFVVTVFDAATRTLKTYLDAQEQGAPAKPFPEKNKLQPRQAGQVRIGISPAGWQNLQGLVDEIRIWDAALTQDEIREHAYQRLSPPRKNLVSYVNLPAPFNATMETQNLAAANAALGTCRDRVTNEAVTQQGGLVLVPSAVPTGGPFQKVGEGEVALFQDPNYQRNSWLFPESAREFDVRSNLSYCDVGSVRVGDRTGARIFAGPNFTDMSQETMSDLPSLESTKLGANKKSPFSIQVYSTLGRPQRGACAILSATEQYLSAKPEEGGAIVLRRSSTVDDEGLFRVETLAARDAGSREVAIQSPAHQTYLRANDDGQLLFRDPLVTERSRWSMVIENGEQRFSLSAPDGRWVESRPDGGFQLATDKQAREIFTLALHAAGDETEVGELRTGEVAFYEKPSYWGRAWVFHSEQIDLRVIKSLAARSIRLGPNTCITLFDQPSYKDTGNAADIVHDTPDLSGSIFKGAGISSFKLWRVVSPGSIGLDSITTLSQDYRTVRGKVAPFSAYRTSVGLPQNVATVVIGVTEHASLEVAGQTRELGADDSWTVPINLFSRLIVTSEAQHLFTAGLKIRTDTMAPDQHIVLFPDQEAHVRLANMKDDDLWEAKDRSGKRVVKDGIQKDAAAHVQSAIKAMMATTDYARGSVDVKNPAAPVRDPGSLRFGAAGWQWTSYSRGITQERMEGAGWILDFNASSGSAGQLSSGLKAGAEGAPVFKVLSAAQVQQVWDGSAAPVGLLGGFGDFFEQLWNEGKQIVHVIVKKVEHAVDQIAVQVRYVTNEVRNFIVSSVTQAAAVGERIFHEVVEGVEKVVEWLAFLFDWDDILATQKELAKNILDGLDFAAKVARDQRQKVDQGIDRFRGQIKESLEAVKARFKTEPPGFSEKRQQSTGARHPAAEEKLHWFMARMTGPGDSMTMNAGAALDAPRAELQDFFDKVRGKVGEIVDDNVRKQFSEALECFVGAFTDPNESFSFDKFIVGILSILEALAETAINLVKFIIDLLFEVVDKLVSWAKTALTAEFPIPLVKDLWYSITKGEPFSALNVVTLAVAIPATVTRKAVTGPSPVHKPAVTDSSISALRATITSNDPDFQRKLTSAIVYSCCSLINGLVSTGLDAMEAGEMIAEPQEIELMGRLPSGRFPPMPTKPGWAKFTVPGSGVLEWVGWITQAGMVVTSWPGGYPFAKMSGFFPEGDPAEGWDSGLWIYETGLAAVDLISMLLPFGKKLRRAGEIQLVIGSILGLGHVLMVLVVMGVELKHKSDWYKAHVVPWKTVQGGLGALSEFLAFLMLPQLTETSEGSTLLAFLATEGVATLSDTGINLYMAIEGLVDPPES